MSAEMYKLYIYEYLLVFIMYCLALSQGSVGIDLSLLTDMCKNKIYFEHEVVILSDTFLNNKRVTKKTGGIFQYVLLKHQICPVQKITLANINQE